MAGISSGVGAATDMLSGVVGIVDNILNMVHEHK